MSLVDDLQAEVKKIFREAWTSRDGQVVPEPEDIKLGNDAVKLDGTVLYADLDDSTDLVDTKNRNSRLKFTNPISIALRR